MQISLLFTVLLSSVLSAPVFGTAGEVIDRNGRAFVAGAKDMFSGPNIKSGLNSVGRGALTAGGIVGTGALVGLGVAGAFAGVNALTAPRATPVVIISSPPQ